MRGTRHSELPSGRNTASWRFGLFGVPGNKQASLGGGLKKNIKDLRMAYYSEPEEQPVLPNIKT